MRDIGHRTSPEALTGREFSWQTLYQVHIRSGPVRARVFLLLIATLFWVARNKFDIPSKAADLKESVGGVTKKEQKVNSGGSGVFDSGRTI